jgi:hypothetical protein
MKEIATQDVNRSGLVVSIQKGEMAGRDEDMQ